MGGVFANDGKHFGGGAIFVADVGEVGGAFPEEGGESLGIKLIVFEFEFGVGDFFGFSFDAKVPIIGNPGIALGDEFWLDNFFVNSVEISWGILPFFWGDEFAEFKPLDDDTPTERFFENVMVHAFDLVIVGFSGAWAFIFGVFFIAAEGFFEGIDGEDIVSQVFGVVEDTGKKIFDGDA